MTRTGTRNPSGSGHVVRLVWTAIGVLALGAGALGLILPLLPTAPFVILAAFAFSKGSSQLAEALHGHRVFGPMIADWRAKGAIAPRYKALALVMMGAVLAASATLALDAVIVALQALVMAGAAGYILSRPNGTA